MTDKLPVRERLLEAAAELFYRDGVGATGIDAITARAGVAKMSLYNNFRSKADLVEGYLQGRVGEWHEVLAQRLAQARRPEDKILAVFDSYLDHAGRAFDWGFRGCGLLNAAAELAAGDPGRTTVVLQKREAERLFQSYLAELRPDAGPDLAQTAQHLSFVLEGGMARAGLEGNAGPLEAARRIAASVVAAFAGSGGANA